MGSFGAVAAAKPPRAAKHPLAGEGPIVSRARRALRQAAAAFGSVSSLSDTHVTVVTPAGLTLTLSYEPGNYVFSRVYAMTVSARLPVESAAPGGVQLSHRGAQPGGTFVAARGVAPPRVALAALNAAAAPHLAETDMVRASISGSRGAGRTLTLSPMGGAFVWVLLPPVSKTAAFPAGEPERLIALVDTVRTLAIPDS